MSKKVVLAYSGGLVSSVAIPWLMERRDAQVVAVTVDLGQSADLAEVRARALAAGAVRAHVIDARDTFVREHVMPSLRADALADGRYPMATALGRPLIASKLIEIARIEDATLVAHGCSGRDRVRVAKPLRTLDPSLRQIACVEEWGLPPDQIAGYADRLGLTPDAPGPDRVDDNLWGRTVGRRGDPASGEAPESVFKLTRPLAQSSAQPVELIESLSTIAGEHGCGRLERVKNHDDGSRSRALYEAPAAVVLHLAHGDLERYVSSETLEKFSRALSATYAETIDRGEWFDPVRTALDASVNATQSRVTGSVRVRLYKGDCRVVGRTLNS